MTPDVVIDVGNTRIKWGRCRNQAIVETASLDPEASALWLRQLEAWQLSPGARYLVSGVQPAWRDRLADWLRQRGESVHLITTARELPLQVRLKRPEGVGIDRLFDAVAANHRRSIGRGAIVIDAGSAVTVDWVDETGAFTGGAILPGLRLMALALHQHTALLPLIETPYTTPPLPGVSTQEAISAGIFWAVVGGVRALLKRYTHLAAASPHVFLTGGDGPLLQPALGDSVQLWPNLTLEGIRLSAESLP